MPLATRRLMALMPLLAGVGAHAASLGEVEVASFLGEPLRAAIPITLDENALPLDACVRLVGPSLPGARVALVSRHGRHRVAISTREPVLDPMLDLTLRAQGCGLSMEKTYVILLSPRGFDIPAERAGGAELPAASPAAAAQTRKAAPTGKRTAKPGKRRARHVLKLDYNASRFAQGAAALAGKRPPAGRAEAPRPTGDRLILSAPEEMAPPPAIAEPARPSAPQADAASARSGLVANVDDTVAKPPATTPAWLTYLVLPLFLIALAAAVSVWLRRRRREFAPEAMPELDTLSPELTELRLPSRAIRTSPPPAAEDFAEPLPAMPTPKPAAVPKPSAPPEAAPLDFADLAPGAIEAKTIQPADVLAEQPASLDHVMELAEVMLAFGRSNQAIETLSQHIRDNPRQAVDPWLKLLDLYHQSDLRNEFDALAGELHRHYNVAIPEWGDYATGPDAGQLSLEALPHIMGRLTETWPTRECLGYLDKLLGDNRGGQRLGFSMAIVRDILLLRDILRQVGPGPAPLH